MKRMVYHERGVVALATMTNRMVPPTGFEPVRPLMSRGF